MSHEVENLIQENMELLATKLVDVFDFGWSYWFNGRLCHVANFVVYCWCA